MTSSVITEAAWLIERRLGPAAQAKFFTLVTNTRFEIIDLTTSDYPQVIELIGC